MFFNKGFHRNIFWFILLLNGLKYCFEEWDIEEQLWSKLSMIASMHANPPNMGNMLMVNAKFVDMARGSEYDRLGYANINKPINTGIKTTVKDNLEPTLTNTEVFVFSIALLGSIRLITISKIHAIIVIRLLTLIIFSVSIIFELIIQIIYFFLI